ncbi:hypothetical protein LSH36_1068g00078 [Paralvinella palmiformis]|uniref:Arf-GAP domain-containing protein n=1 Tax=Paralvinella palmiformis TaxID=53620 RepID=A0AAD9IW16_9ANNE|nr:hypothetical protein LSH36_1068g00078 [Paralvinella palmiformis]
MTTRQERDKNKGLQDRHQMILTQLLKDEDNKYCVDCDAKGPRWASWNIGIFLCIRCAGIHRNMGVHISKVKSVNLDTWTSEQIAMMQEMGNSRARAVYEANLPDNFRRPQTDSGLEAFIRAKYEHKKYIAQEWVPPQPKVQVYNDEMTKKEKKKPRSKPTSSVNLNNIPPSSGKSASSSNSKTETKTEKPASKQSAAEIDLLGLDAPAAVDTTSAASADPFGDFITGSSTAEDLTSSQGQCETPSDGGSSAPDGSTSNSLGDLNLLSESGSSQDKQKVTKESILALYGSSGSGTQMFGVPGNGGMYMPAQQQHAAQQPPQQQMWAAGPLPNGMMSGNAAMMNPQSGMGMMPLPPTPNLMCGGQQLCTAQPDTGDLMIVDPVVTVSCNHGSICSPVRQCNVQQPLWRGPHPPMPAMMVTPNVGQPVGAVPGQAMGGSKSDVLDECWWRSHANGTTTRLGDSWRYW